MLGRFISFVSVSNHLIMRYPLYKSEHLRQLKLNSSTNELIYHAAIAEDEKANAIRFGLC